MMVVPPPMERSPISDGRPVNLAQVETTLARFLSPINTRVVMERSTRVLADPRKPRASEWPAYLRMVITSARMFLSDARLAELTRALEGGDADALGPQRPKPRDLVVKTEDDLRVARLVAREMCEAMGAAPFVTQRVATSVSELVRNIIAYTPGGTLRLEPLEGSPPRLRIVAQDQGTGIPHIQEVLGGTYRSKTGLGRGLMGVRQLMASFDIRTGPTGTKVTAEAIL